jgi:hypothetical protein
VYQDFVMPEWVLDFTSNSLNAIITRLGIMAPKAMKKARGSRRKPRQGQAAKE